jgi:hypothetical protein
MSSQQCALLALPAKIRNTTWGYALFDQSTIIVRNRRQITHGIHTLHIYPHPYLFGGIYIYSAALLRTYRQIRAETKKIYLIANTFHYQTVINLQHDREELKQMYKCLAGLEP